MNPLLQPEDSKRVADALLKELENADFDVSTAVHVAVNGALQADLTCGLGAAIVSVIERSVENAVMNCIGSREMGDIVRNAIEEGMDRMPTPRPMTEVFLTQGDYRRHRAAPIHRAYKAPSKRQNWNWQPRPYIPLSSATAAQIAQPSMCTEKNPDTDGNDRTDPGAHAQPGVSRVAQRPAPQAEAPEKASVPGSNPAVLPATGPTNSPD